LPAHRAQGKRFDQKRNRQMAQAQHTKRSEKGLLTPDNCVVAFIDHQAQMLFGTFISTGNRLSTTPSLSPRPVGFSMFPLS
jgi:hypothetical protein